MDTSKVILIGKHIKPIPESEIAAAEAQLGVTLPSGYKQLMQTFGIGDYCDLFRIAEPQVIVQELEEFRKFWQEHFKLFFEDNEGHLTPAQIQQSIRLGDSMDGDEIIFYPPTPKSIYILPRHDEYVDRLKSDFSDLHLWRSENPVTPLFQPAHSRASITKRSIDYTLDRETCLAKLRAQWGKDSLVETYERYDDWSWTIITYIPVIGGRFQITQDEGVTRTTPHGTYGAGGQRYLHLRFGCDMDDRPAIYAFLDSFETEGLVAWER